MTYTRRGSNTGGTGSEWHGDWFFAIDAPPSDGHLTVRVSSPEGNDATVTLDLAGR